MFYDNLLYSAYLRPKESHSANTRLFFGVYQKTGREKTKNGYDLKVARIVSISSAENTVCSVEELHILLISISVGSQQRTFFIVYMSLRCPIKQRNRLHANTMQAV